MLLVSNIYANKQEEKNAYLTHCASCHSIDMSGSLGKDFNLVSYERTKDEIRAYATQPGRLYRSFGYSENAMPTLPLTSKELDAVVNYIDSLQQFKKSMLNKKDKI